MKIFFDARMIDHPGIGRYVRNTLSFLRKENNLQLYILGKKNIIKQFLSFNGEIIDFPHPLYSLREQKGYFSLKRLIGNNVFHIPHYNIPLIREFNLVVTIHDLTHIIYPRGASSKFAPIYMRVMIKRALRISRKIICVSYNTSRLLKEIFKEESPKVKVIYEGIDEVFFQKKDEGYLKEVKHKYDLPDKFILYVGSLRRHKNIELLLKVFDKLKRRLPNFWLILVGRSTHFFNLNKERVRYLGEIVEDGELAVIYQLASCFCNLSLSEGFNLTILEAQKCGVPVVCSNIAVHLEIGGEGIYPVSVSNIDQIEESLYNVVTNQELKDTLVTKGEENARRFSWQLAGAKLTELYKDIAREEKLL